MQRPALAPLAALALLAAALLALLPATPASAQEDPNAARGFRPEQVYDFDGVESVNLFNGNLLLTVPIGGEYSVDGGLSYSLSLVYNGIHWQRGIAEKLNQDPEIPPIYYPYVIPGGHFNAGVGWRLSLGELERPEYPSNPTNRWQYRGEDAAQHAFWPTLHPGEPAVAGTSYSRDGSYLRLRELSSLVAEVDFPDGTVRRFVRGSSHYMSPYRLTAIRDSFGNQLTVTYTGSTLWTLSDGHRTHYVHLAPVTVDGVTRYFVTEVDLAAFGGGRAEYAFSYTTLAYERPADGDPATGATVSAPFLSQVTLPTEETWRMESYYTTEAEGSGQIARLGLPTGGAIAWSYASYFYPQRQGIVRPDNGGSAYPGVDLTESKGVATRRLLDAAGNCVSWDGVGCEWRYEPLAVDLDHRKTKVTLPNGDSRVHYFNQDVDLSTAGWTGWHYGLPVYLGASSGGHHLSEEVWDGAVKVRSIYRSYERDVVGTSNTLLYDWWYDTNRRASGERTVYHDDGGHSVDVARSDFDGLGHYRLDTRTGSFGAAASRSAFTGYNPGRSYEVNEATNTGPAAPSGGPAGAWVLETWDRTWQQQGSSTVHERHCFDPATGFLKRRRVLAGTSEGAADVIVEYQAGGTGNLRHERFFGGDRQVVGTSSALCTLALPAAPAFWRQHEYLYGSRRTTWWSSPAGAFLGHYDLRLTIDANTGLAAASFDVAGLETAYEHDAAGRLTWEKPATGHGAWNEYSYTNALGTAPASVRGRRRAGGSKSGAVLAETEHVYDAWGRLWRDRRLGADGNWSSVDTVWNSLGWKIQESVRDHGFPSRRTRYLLFDPFGQPPGWNRRMGRWPTFSFAGERRHGRTVSVQTTDSGPTAQTTWEEHDAHGRLEKVTENSGPAGAAVSTTYSYDAGGRLHEVGTIASGTTQIRRFTRDGRGFLLTEKHPEIGAAGNGTVSWSAYDALGNAGRKVAGPFDLTFEHDAAGRLVRERETSGAGRPLKEIAWGSANSGSDLRLGKRWTAERYNYVLLGGTPFTVRVRETYQYAGKGGAVSRRDTQMWVDGAAAESFTQSFAWNDLGDQASVGFPQCTHAACATPSPRTVSFGYTRGHLTSVPGFVDELRYHPNGMLSQVAHANGVTDRLGAHASGLARPAWIDTTGASSNWASGAYGYDGAGNVTAVGASRYVYDPVGRLAKSTVATGQDGNGTLYARSYSYDAFGNLTAMTPVVPSGGLPGRTIPVSPATNRLNGVGVTYDAAGNLTAWNGQSYGVDAYGLAWRVHTGSDESLHFYTADDQRFWTYQWSGSRWTLRDLEGRVLREYASGPGGWRVERDYVHAPVHAESRLVAAASPADFTTYHYHPDHLGTPRLITNAQGFKVAYHAYWPFGEELTAGTQDDERRKFAGHERDLGNLYSPADDLDYHHARFYNPQLGRYLSVDPAASGRPNAPQSWNRYAYSRSNPLTLLDPDGRESRAAIQLDQDIQAVLRGDMSRAEYHERNAARAQGALAGLSLLLPGPEDLAIGAILGGGLRALGIGSRAAGVAADAGRGRLASVLQQKLRNDLARSATAAGTDGVSAVTRAIQKHAAREVTAFSPVSGNLAGRNAGGRALVDDILGNPGTTFTQRTTGRFGEVLDVVAPDGRGLRFGADGHFIGLLEPPL